MLGLLVELGGVDLGDRVTTILVDLERKLSTLIEGVNDRGVVDLDDEKLAQNLHLRIECGVRWHQVMLRVDVALV